jgi:hypothetical protein
MYPASGFEAPLDNSRRREHTRHTAPSLNLRLEVFMKPSPARVPVLAAERPSNGGQLLFWLLGARWRDTNEGPSQVAEGFTAPLPVHPCLPNALRLVRHGRRGTPLWRYRESAR